MSKKIKVNRCSIDNSNFSAKYRTKDRRFSQDQQWRPGKTDSPSDFAKGNSQSRKRSFEKSADAIKLFSANKSILIIESDLNGTSVI